MTQPLATSAKVIYDVLASDATFLSLIGTYTWIAGGSATALSIVSPGENIPGAKGVNGVECVITDIGDMTPEYKYDGLISSNMMFRVFLIAWDGATGADVQRAAERICQRFPGSDSIDTTATPDGLGSLVQTMVQIKSSMPILAA